MKGEQVPTYFSISYEEARQKFLRACTACSLRSDSHLNPLAKGVNGEDLYMDVVRIGNASAPKVLLLMSGTHGVEGYCGSGVQVGLLSEQIFEGLPEDISVVIIHAMNPFGFSHDRRVNEDNVDLNRNFIDFEKLDRPQSDYGAIHSFILPPTWDDEHLRQANAGLEKYKELNGMEAFQAAVSSGQYTHADGLFYGGDWPVWSNMTFRQILADCLSDAKVIAALDFHTGLGPYGYGELIAIGSEAQKQRAVQWYGDQVTDSEAGTSTSADLVGMAAHGISDELPHADVIFTTVEFGTHPIDNVLTALRWDNWLNVRGDIQSPIGKRIKQNIKDTFYPDTDDWKQHVWTRSREVIAQAITGLKDAKII